MKVEVYLITASYYKYNKKLLKTFDSLKKEFNKYSFVLLDYDIDKAKIDKITSNETEKLIHTIPSWVILEEKALSILNGDVLIKPIRHFLKECI